MSLPMSPECRLEGPGQPSPSHTLPPGHFQSLPRIAQIAADDGNLYALTVTGEVWWSYLEARTGWCPWRQVPALPSSSPVEP